MKYVIANLKSHKTTSEVNSWLSDCNNIASDAKIIAALPFPYLYLAKSIKLELAAQDVSPFPPGSYTGAVNAAQLSDLGVKYCIIGHSERRQYFHETSVEVADKAEELLSSGITPIICISENELSSQFAALAEETIKNSIFAYEVLTDIGGNETTPIPHIVEIIALFKKYTNGNSLGLLYGGSVNPANVSSLVGIVDGLLVATASLDSQSFAQVVQGFTSHV